MSSTDELARVEYRKESPWTTTDVRDQEESIKSGGVIGCINNKLTKEDDIPERKKTLQASSHSDEPLETFSSLSGQKDEERILPGAWRRSREGRND